jgi:hypothetical protein
MAFSVVLFRAKIFQSRIHEKDFGPPRQWGTGTKAPVMAGLDRVLPSLVILQP